jgi:TetR/AcrR family transcriptional regulator, tetracycline repressor protein
LPQPEKAKHATSTQLALGTILRGDIARAAVAIAEVGAVKRMTIRSLAAELGAPPMALYRHIRSKNDLGVEVVDKPGQRVAHLPAPQRRTGVAHRRCQQMRQFLVSQPAALHVDLAHPVVSPAALERMTAIVAVLRAVGLDDAAPGRAYGALHSHAVGLAALEASRSRWTPQKSDLGGALGQLASHTSTPARISS